MIDDTPPHRKLIDMLDLSPNDHLDDIMAAAVARIEFLQTALIRYASCAVDRKVVPHEDDEDGELTGVARAEKYEAIGWNDCLDAQLNKAEVVRRGNNEERATFKAHFMAEGWDEHSFDRYNNVWLLDAQSYKCRHVQDMWDGWSARSTYVIPPPNDLQARLARFKEKKCQP